METLAVMVYIGTYTTGESRGIYAFRLHESTGALKPTGSFAAKNPSYLSVSSNNRFIYAVVENDTAQGAILAFLVDNDGMLLPVNTQPAKVGALCHLTTDRENRYIFAAGYREGIVSAFPICSDGSVGPLIKQIRHIGSGPDQKRQERAHAHCTVLTPDEKFLCVADLGMDKIMLYALNDKTGELNGDNKYSASIRPGFGPRHMVFHPSGKYVYVVNELQPYITVLKYTPAGSFQYLQNIALLPDNYIGKSYGAAIRISPDGQFLYASNRGHDSITVYNLDSSTGKLEAANWISTEGSWPRDFSIAPGGRFLLAANQYSGTIVPFVIDQKTGLFERTGDSIKIPDPACIAFVGLDPQ